MAETNGPPGIAAAAAPVAPSVRTGLPPNASPINLHATPTPTPPLPASFPEQPPVETSLPPGVAAPTATTRSPTSSPRGRPPVFLPGVAQQLIPGEEAVDAATTTPVEMPAPTETPDVPMPDITHMPQLPPALPAAMLQSPAVEHEFYDHPLGGQYGNLDFAMQPWIPAAYKFKLLGDKLAGVIMGCTDSTKDECISGGIFGLPAKHWDYLQAVHEGKTFYLFNYSRRSLHGVFKSVEPATWQLNPHGWCPNPHMETQFPAQIRVERVDTYPCLREEEYGPILRWKGNYVGNTQKFSFELDEEQVEKLNEIFQTTKETEPNRPEPPIVTEGQSHGYGGRGYGYQRRDFGYGNRFGYGRGGGYGFGGGGYGYGRGRGRGGRFRPSFAPRGYSGRGPPRGRAQPLGSPHPLARGVAPRPGANTAATSRVAMAPPPRPAVEPPPGMGAAPSALFQASGLGLPERPSAAPVAQP